MKQKRRTEDFMTFCQRHPRTQTWNFDIHTAYVLLKRSLHVREHASINMLRGILKAHWNYSIVSLSEGFDSVCRILFGRPRRRWEFTTEMGLQEAG